MTARLAFIAMTMLIALPCTPMTVRADENASLVETMPFTIDILGADSFADIDTIHRGLMNADGVRDISVIRSNRGFTRLAGTMEGNGRELMGDLKGLALDRFSVETVGNAGNGLLVTLRKLGRQAAP